jgi:hypothetical protein
MLPNVLFAFALLGLTGRQEAIRLEPYALHLRIDQSGGLSVDVLQAVLTEVGRIWSPAGVTMTSGAYADPIPTGSAIVSVRMVPDKSTKDGRHILGWVVPPADVQGIPTVFISLTAVQALLTTARVKGKLLMQYPTVLRNRLTGQAIGRVLAHELGHYLLRNQDHARSGLMRPVYTTTDLLASAITPFQIGPQDWPAARQEILRLAEVRPR